jgi:hypothetical protein
LEGIKMARKDPNAVGAKWLTGMQGAADAYNAGIDAVTVAPGQAAAAAKDTWAANVAASKDRFATNSAKVTKEAWQTAAKTKGSARLADGAQAAAPKFNAFMNKFLPDVYGKVAQLPPRGSYAQNKTRATAMMDALHNSKGQYT